MKFKTLIAAAALVGAAASSHAIGVAGFIYGLNRGDAGGGIYRLDIGTGATTLHRTTPSIVGSVDGNGLAHDLNDTFWYVGDGSNPTLYRNDSNGEVALGTIQGSIASATFWNGNYYYVRQSTNQLRVINGANGALIQSITMTGIPASGYGDIAFAPNGVLYGASENGGLFRFDLSTGTGSILNANVWNRQLGFYGNTLYGVETNTDRVFSYNLITGAETFVTTLQPSSRIIQDAASVVPEPGTIAAITLGLAGLAARRRRA